MRALLIVSCCSIIDVSLSKIVFDCNHHRRRRQYVKYTTSIGIADFTSNAGYTGQSIVAAYTLAGMADNTEQVDIGSTLHLNGRFSRTMHWEMMYMLVLRSHLRMDS